MIVRELITKLGFQLDQSQVTAAEKGIARVKDTAQKLGDTIRNALFAFGGFHAVKSIITIGDDMQNMRSRIAMLPQTVTTAAESFDIVAEHASIAGMSVEAYAGMYVKLGNAAKDLLPTQESILSVTDTLSKALVVGGASTQEQSAALMQFGQALGSGVLQGDEFRSMAEAAPQYLDELSKALNIPRENLKKMASEGKLTAKAVIEATQKMSVVFDEKFKQMPMTVGRAMTMVGNKFKMAIDRMNRSTMFVTTIANNILKAFDKIEAGVTWLIDKFGGLENMLRMIGITVGVVIGGKAVQAILALRGVAAVAILPFVKLAAAIAAVALVVEDLYVWVQGGDSLTGKLIGPWEEWRAYVMATFMMIKDAVTWVGEFIGAMLATLSGLLVFDFALMKEGWMGMSQMLYDLLGQWITYAVQSLSKVGTAIWDTVAGAFDRLTTYVGEVFLGWALSLSKSLTDGFNKVKSFFGIGGTSAAQGAANGTAPAGMAYASTVAPAALAPSNMGAARPSITSNTQVNVTVPPGTTQEQTKYLETAAQKSFTKQSNAALARDVAVIAP